MQVEQIVEGGGEQRVVELDDFGAGILRMCMKGNGRSIISSVCLEGRHE